jgi:hypothetical protein
MTCETVKPLLSEMVDERLDAATAWQVQAHVAGCADCGQVRREVEALTQALGALPAHKPSAGFDAALAQRIALTRRPQAAPETWWETWMETWHERMARASGPAPARLRPALALGFAVTAVGAVALFPQFISQQEVRPPAPLIPAARAADHAFVADCVAQRRRDAAGEPLADLSAQNLAGNLDGAAPAGPPASDVPPAPTGPPASDAGIF